MNPQEKALLEETYKLAQANNEILRSMRRSSRIGAALHALYWVIIIVTSYGAYYFIQPYLDTMLGIVNNAGGLTGIQNSLNEAQGAADSLKSLMNK